MVPSNSECVLIKGANMLGCLLANKLITLSAFVSDCWCQLASQLCTQVTCSLSNKPAKRWCSTASVKLKVNIFHTALADYFVECGFIIWAVCHWGSQYDVPPYRRVQMLYGLPVATETWLPWKACWHHQTQTSTTQTQTRWVSFCSLHLMLIICRHAMR